MEFVELLQNRESQKPEKFRGPKNPSKQAQKTTRARAAADTEEARHRARHQQRNHTTGQRQATETSNAQEQPRQAPKHDRTRRHRNKANSTDATPTPNAANTHANPAPHTRQPANAQPTPPAPNARNNRPRTLAREHEKRNSTERLVHVKCWLHTTTSHRARDMPSKGEIALQGCFGPL